MKKMQAGLAIAALATLGCGTALAQVQAASGATVTSGANVVVTPGAPVVHTGSMVHHAETMPSNVQANLLPGGAMVQAGEATVVAGAPGTHTTTTITRYWVNVPRDVQNDPSFQRWQRLD